MRKLRVLLQSLLFVLFLVTAAGVEAGPAAYEIQVDGLACPFCAYGIEKALGKLEGVKRVETNIDSGVVTVTMADDAKLTREQVQTAVEDKAGFTLQEFEPVISADGS